MQKNISKIWNPSGEEKLLGPIVLELLASADTNPSKKSKRKKVVAGENMIKVKKEPTTGSDVRAEVSAIHDEFVDIVFMNRQNSFVQKSWNFFVHPFRLPKLTDKKKTKLLINLIEQKDPELARQIHGWFVDEGIIEEDAQSEDGNDTQMNEFYNPKPGSKYWEESKLAWRYRRICPHYCCYDCVAWFVCSS